MALWTQCGHIRPGQWMLDKNQCRHASTPCSLLVLISVQHLICVPKRNLLVYKQAKYLLAYPRENAALHRPKTKALQRDPLAFRHQESGSGRVPAPLGMSEWMASERIHVDNAGDSESRLIHRRKNGAWPRSQPALWIYVEDW